MPISGYSLPSGEFWLTKPFSQPDRKLRSPKQLLAVLVALLLTPALAAAGALNGGWIVFVNWDKASYTPGATAYEYVTLANSGGSAFTGTLSAALTNGRGLAQTSPSPQAVSLAAGATATFTFAFNPPATVNRGYLVKNTLVNASSVTQDTASGALDVVTDWKTFPRCGFISAASVGVGYNPAPVVQNLNSYRVNCIQWYDVNWKHQQPYSPAATWPNLAGITISRAALDAGLAAAHGYGMMNFDYQLINGTWDHYTTDGSGVGLSAGEFTSACAPGCTLANQNSYGPFPPSWSSLLLYTMDPGNSAWRAQIERQQRLMLANHAFDGIQLDTLGAPGSQLYTFTGAAIDESQNLVSFVNVLSRSLGARVILNPVSGRALTDVMQRANIDVVYNEIHPEFGDTPFYPSLNGLASQIRATTTRGAVIPAYIQTTKATNPVCHTAGGPTTCTFTPASVELLEAQMLASGLNHWEFGDLNIVCPVSQAKIISNIYVTGPQLCMDASTQEWMQDAANFAVAYENVLRWGVTDAPEGWAITGAPSSSVGAAGAIYVMPKTKAGMQILSLLNLVGESTNNSQDTNGVYPMPTAQTNLVVKMYHQGALSSSRLWWASPDVLHGAVQTLSYTTGLDGTGAYITFTLPSLAKYDLVVLETTALSGSDFNVSALAPIRGVADQAASPGVNSSSYFTGNACCGLWAMYEGVDFGGGVSHLALTYSSLNDSRVEARLDSPTGAVVASGVLTKTASNIYNTIIFTASGATGVHKLYLLYPDQTTLMGTFVFS